MRNLIIGFILIACISVNAQTEIRNDSTIIKSKLRIRNHNEGNGKVLTSDALGNASWQSPTSTTNFWQIGSASTEIIPTPPIAKVKIPGTLQIPTGGGLSKYLKSDASGNATWSFLPPLGLTLPYSDGISNSSTAFEIQNADPTGFVLKTSGNVELKQINEKTGRILFSTDDLGNAKWGDGACISKCSFSTTRSDKASMAGNAVHFLPFSIELFDVCNANNLVDVTGENDFYAFTAPFDGIYQFDFVGTFLYTAPFALGIYTLDASNQPGTQLFSSLATANATERTEKFTAILKLTAGTRIAPTVQGSLANGNVAFNNSQNTAGTRFSGHIIEATNCFEKK